MLSQGSVMSQVVSDTRSASKYMRSQDGEAREVGKKNQDIYGLYIIVHYQNTYYLQMFIGKSIVEYNSFLPLESKTIIMYCHAVMNAINVPLRFYSLGNSVIYYDCLIHIGWLHYLHLLRVLKSNGYIGLARIMAVSILKSIEPGQLQR